MNANQLPKKEEAKSVPLYQPTNHLRVLSKLQRKQVSVIAKDWQRFAGGLFGQMFDKI